MSPGDARQTIFIRLLLILAVAYTAWSYMNRGGVGEGHAAPEIELSQLLQAPQNLKRSLRSIRDKYVVLDFWATWCGPCVQSIPHLNQLAGAFEDQPVQFIAITEENEATVTPFLDRYPINAWVGLDHDGQTFRAFGVKSIPTTFVIGPDGRILRRSHPMELTEAKLAGLIGAD